MGPVRVVVIDVVDDEPLELAAVPDDGAVEELASQGADPAFGERVRHGGAYRCGEDLAAFGSEDLVEGVDELAAAVAHECPSAGELVDVTEQQVPRGLGGPDAAGVVRDPYEVHAPGPDVDEEQQVEPAQRDRVDGGEVAGDGGLGPQELRPSDFRACGCGIDSGVVEDLPRPWTQRGGGRARRARRGCGDIPKSDSRLRGAVRVGEAPLMAMAGPAVAVAGSSVGRCGGGASATVCRG